MIELTKSEYILELEREYMFLSLAETLPTVGKFHYGHVIQKPVTQHEFIYLKLEGKL